MRPSASSSWHFIIPTSWFTSNKFCGAIFLWRYIKEAPALWPQERVDRITRPNQGDLKLLNRPLLRRYWDALKRISAGEIEDEEAIAQLNDLDAEPRLDENRPKVKRNRS